MTSNWIYQFHCKFRAAMHAFTLQINIPNIFNIRSLYGKVQL
jgi:hypothetical protein